MVAKKSHVSYSYLLFLIAFQMVLTFGGCNQKGTTTPLECSGKHSDPPLALLKIPTSGGPLLYSGVWGGGLNLPCTYRLESITNDTQVPIRIVEKSVGGGGCLASTVRLDVHVAGNDTTNSAQIMKAFGEMHPKAPLTITACVDAGGDPPDKVLVIVTYQSSK